MFLTVFLSILFLLLDKRPYSGRWPGNFLEIRHYHENSFPYLNLFKGENSQKQLYKEEGEEKEEVNGENGREKLDKWKKGRKSWKEEERNEK
jgi:hypothetical protein